MKKVCFLVAGMFPIPAVCGGAVETLVQNIIDYNEIEPTLEITVLTIKNRQAKALYGNYKHTHFITVPSYRAANKIYWKITGFVRKCFHKEIIAPLQKYAEIRFIKKNADKFDILIEELDVDAFLAAGDKINFEKKALHLHSEGEPSHSRDASFAYLLAISNFIGNSWMSNTGRKSDTIFDLPNCIKIKNFMKKISAAEKIQIRKRLGIPTNHIVVLYIGRIIPEKGVKELIEAVNLIKQQSLSLLLVGSSQFGNKNMTPYEKEISRMIHESSHNIVQTGFIPNDELYKIQNISDIAVVPSIWNEPAGLVVLEAQAAGLPVIASRVGGIAQFLGENAGILIERDGSFVEKISDAIEKLADSPDMRVNMGSLGIRWASKHDVKDYYHQFIKILEQIDTRHSI